ncbi:glycoside hydrolase family 76 protein [Catellatospora coxensis]
MGDWSARTGRSDYRWLIDRTYELNKGVMPAGQKSGDAIEGNFISRAIDDTGWWALAWVQAYDVTRDAKFLNTAVTIANYMHSYWDGVCGGGVWWNRERTYKNAVTIGLYVRLTAALHNRIAGDTLWLGRANAGWNWFRASGMINGSGLVNDGITGGCANNGQTVWTYNQGLAIGGAVELWRATGNASLLTQARQLADAAMNSAVLTRSGILTESCDPANSCDDNQKQFKGIFMRYLMDLADASGVAAYRTYAQRQVDSIWQYDRDSLNRIGQRWPAAPRTRATGAPRPPVSARCWPRRRSLRSRHGTDDVLCGDFPLWCVGGAERARIGPVRALLRDGPEGGRPLSHSRPRPLPGIMRPHRIL